MSNPESFTPEYFESLSVEQIFEHLDRVYKEVKSSPDRLRFYDQYSCSVVSEFEGHEEFKVRAGRIAYTKDYSPDQRAAFIYALEGQGFTIPIVNFLQLKDVSSFKDTEFFSDVTRELRKFLITFYTASPVEHRSYVPVDEKDRNRFIDMLVQYKIVSDSDRHILYGFYTYFDPSQSPMGNDVLGSALDSVELEKERSKRRSFALPEGLSLHRGRSLVPIEEEAKVLEQYAGFEPRSKESDELLHDLFVSWYGELSKISNTIDQADEEARDAMRIRVANILANFKSVVEKRGANDHGRHGDWFWTTSEVEDMYTTHGYLMHRFASLAENKYLRDVFGN